jgi:hypothetical protein
MVRPSVTGVHRAASEQARPNLACPVPATAADPQLSRQLRIGGAQEARIAERLRATASMVATASYSGVESGARYRAQPRPAGHLQSPVGGIVVAPHAT